MSDKILLEALMAVRFHLGRTVAQWIISEYESQINQVQMPSLCQSPKEPSQYDLREPQNTDTACHAVLISLSQKSSYRYFYCTRGMDQEEEWLLNNLKRIFAYEWNLEVSTKPIRWVSDSHIKNW